MVTRTRASTVRFYIACLVYSYIKVIVIRNCFICVVNVVRKEFIREHAGSFSKDMTPCSIAISCRHFGVYFRAVTGCQSHVVMSRKTTLRQQRVITSGRTWYCRWWRVGTYWSVRPCGVFRHSVVGSPSRVEMSKKTTENNYRIRPQRFQASSTRIIIHCRCTVMLV